MAKAKKLKSGSWRCLVYDYTDTAGKRHYRSFTSDDTSSSGKREAEYLAAEFAVQKKSKSHSNSITFKDALDNYITAREEVLSPATIREYRRSQKNFELLDDIKIYDLRQDTIQKHINNFSLIHSPKSVRDNHGLIAAVLKENRPEMALNTILPQKKRPNLYIPNDNEIKKVMQVVKGTDMELPVLLASFGPMRRGEICALHSNCISGNRVHVCKNMVQDTNLNWVIKQPKSYAGDRFIDYPDFVAEKFKNINGPITDLIPTRLTNRFSKILIQAEVPHFRFHDLRHYCASILHAMNIPDAYIMERGGWGNDATLKNVYRHTLEDKKTEMTNKANEYFNAMQHEMQHKK